MLFAEFFQRGILFKVEGMGVEFILLSEFFLYSLNLEFRERVILNYSQNEFILLNLQWIVLCDFIASWPCPSSFPVDEVHHQFLS